MDRRAKLFVDNRHSVAFWDEWLHLGVVLCVLNAVVRPFYLFFNLGAQTWDTITIWCDLISLHIKQIVKNSSEKRIQAVYCHSYSKFKLSQPYSLAFASFIAKAKSHLCCSPFKRMNQAIFFFCSSQLHEVFPDLDYLSDADLTCDIVCLVYDISNPYSFDYCAKVFKVQFPC